MTDYTYVHPGIAANPAATVSIRDKNNPSIVVNSANFVITSVSGSTNSTSFSFTHPAMAASPAATLTVRDKNTPSISTTVTFAVSGTGNPSSITSFTFLHPGMTANGSATVSIRDKNTQSIIQTSNNFVVSAIVVAKSCSVITPISVPAHQAFPVSGSLTGYNYAPNLQYQDNNDGWIDLPGSASVLSAAFSFTHPGISATSSLVLKIRDKDLTSVTTTSNPLVITVVYTESENNAFITLANSEPIVDINLNKYNLATSSSFGLQVTINGVVDTSTSNVLMILYNNHVVYYENTDGNYYSKATPISVWMQTTDPRSPTFKRCTISLPSPLFANQSFTVNGTLNGYISSPILEYRDNNDTWNVLPLNSLTSNVDYSFTHRALGLVSGATISVRDKSLPNIFVVSQTFNTIATPSSDEGISVLRGDTSTIIDSSGNYWSLSVTGQVILNTVPDGSTKNVIVLYYDNNVIYYQDTSQSWFKKVDPNDVWYACISPYLNQPLGLRSRSNGRAIPTLPPLLQIADALKSLDDALDSLNVMLEEVSDS